MTVLKQGALPNNGQTSSGGSSLGNWDPATNTPTLPSVPTAPTYKVGDYYISTGTGTRFGFDWTPNDRIVVVPNGSFLAWNQEIGGAVDSVFGRTGAVVAESGDYAAFYQAILSGAGIVKSNNGTISYISGTSSQFVKADGSLDSNTYLTANQTVTLSGEASGSGATSISVTLANSAVIGKVLTGLNIIGSQIVSSDTILQAFGKTQSQINSLVSGSFYQGAWNASTNSPTLADGTGTAGFFYTVSVAGTQNLGSGPITFDVNDQVKYSSGGVWQRIPNTDAVTSVNGFVGDVVLTTSDIAEGSNQYFTNARAIASTLTGYSSTTGTISSSDSILTAIEKLNGNMAGLVTGVSSVFGRTGTITAQNGDYAASQITNTPSGNISATNIQAAINELDSEVTNLTTDLAAKAPLASPAFTGNPTAPTQTANDNSTKLATTAYADGQSSNASVIAKVLTGFTAGAGVVSATDSILSAFQKVVGNISALTTGVSSVFGRSGAVTAQTGDYDVSQVTGAEATANKDASGGYAGLTLFKINFKNAANTFTSFFTNSNSAARTYTFQDRDGTIADDTDLAAKQNTLTSANFGTFSSGLAAKTTPVDADSMNLSDSAASNNEKKVTWANIKATLKTYFDTLYVALNGALGTPSSGTLTNCTGLPVAGGGTGVASTTAYGVLCGGTTTTGALQNAGAGTAGLVLTSNGASALPSWQAASVPSGSIIQVVNTETGTIATGSTIMPVDNTIPQSNEGDQYMSLAITPTNSSNKLKIDVVFVASSSVANTIEGALFQDSTANALASCIGYQPTATGPLTQSFTHFMTAGTTSPTTFKVRIGCPNAGTTTFNGSSGVQVHGGVLASSITITEIKA